MLRIAFAATVLVGCGPSAKECDSAVKAMTARITSELQSQRAIGMVNDQVRTLDYTQPDEPAIAVLAEVAASEPTFAPGMVLRYGPDGFDKGELVAALHAAQCDAKRTATPATLYLAAPATTTLPQLAPVVAQSIAAKVEPRLLVRSRETVYSSWPPSAPADTKAFFKAMVADENAGNKASAVADRVKSAIAGCPAIAKRIQEAGEGPEDGARELAFAQGLRDCKCSDVNLARVEAEQWLMMMMSYRVGGLPLRTDAATKADATLGDAVRDLRLGPTTTLAVGTATPPAPPAASSCEQGTAFIVTREEKWEHPAPKTLEGYITDCIKWIGQCRGEASAPLYEILIDVGLTGDAVCRWQDISGAGYGQIVDASECSKDRVMVTFDVPATLAEPARAAAAERAEIPSYQLKDTPDASWGYLRIRRYEVQ